MRKRLTAALVVLCAWLLPVLAFAAAGGQLTNGRQQFLNGSGAPLASGAVYIYQPNTTTPVTTYQDPNLTVANTNPIILDSNGMASIWVAPGNYRELVQDSLGNQLWDTTTTAVGTSAAALSPGATVGTNGDVNCTATQFTGASAITLPCTINTNAVSNTKLAQAPANTLKGNNTGSTANEADLTAAQVAAMLPLVTGTAQGMAVPIQYAQFQYQQPSGTSISQTISGGSWVQLAINTSLSNTIPSASMSGNQITLPAGTYKAFGWAACGTASNVGNFRLRLRDFTHSITLLTGGSNTSGNGIIQSTLPVDGFFTLSATSAVELDVYASANNLSCGSTQNDGDPEVGDSLSVQKIG